MVSGDSLSRIADEHEVNGGWRKLYTDNRSVVGGDPDLIYPGQRLSLRAARPPRQGPYRGTARRQAQGGAETGPEGRAQGEGESEAEGGAEEDRAAQAGRAAQEDPAGVPAHGGYIRPVSGVGPSTPYRSSGSSWSSGHHTGVDFPVTIGTSVKAVHGGKVVAAGWGGPTATRSSSGTPTAGTASTRTSQLSVRAGQSVNTGQQVGRSGSTGNATGPHLHFEIRTGPEYGSDIDPLAYLRAHGVSI
ncbi:LysM peptidoglycan-binding domain-containing M23 family metallopeptidase [Streptomyces sp. M19]